MLIEPTLLDIEKQWETNRDSFGRQEWKDTGLTPAEWAWLKHPSFWNAARQPPMRNDNISWWDWSAAHMSGNNLKTNLKILKAINSPCDASSLTNILISATKVKLGLSQDDTKEIVKILLSNESLNWTNEHKITLWDAALATKEISILKTILDYAVQNNINLNAILEMNTKNNLLHKATTHDWEPGIRTLIEYGVSTEHLNNEKITPREYAIQGEYKNALKGFSIKKEITKKPPMPKVTKQDNQMDLF